MDETTHLQANSQENSAIARWHRIPVSPEWMNVLISVAALPIYAVFSSGTIWNFVFLLHFHFVPRNRTCLKHGVFFTSLVRSKQLRTTKLGIFILKDCETKIKPSTKLWILMCQLIIVSTSISPQDADEVSNTTPSKIINENGLGRTRRHNLSNITCVLLQKPPCTRNHSSQPATELDMIWQVEASNVGSVGW